MNAAPWADPRAPLDKRLVAAEIATANVDRADERRAIMRELVDGSLEDAAARLDGLAASLPARSRQAPVVRGMAGVIRAMKADAPAG